MDLIDRIKIISDKFNNLQDNIGTEEATKNALVLPFIQSLGYDVFNPLEVNPEFTADIWLKKWEKVDYCILKEWQPIIIIECKHWKEKLDKHDSQLHRYFHVTKAKFWILTNWIEYKFYTDLDEINKMDYKPFLIINIQNINENIISEIVKFQKSHFDVEKITDSASLLKYSNIINSFFRKEIDNPTDEFIKFLGWMVYEWKVTKNVIEKLRPVVKKSLMQFVNDIANEKLKSALWEDIQTLWEWMNENWIKKIDNEITLDNQKESKEVETTLEELEAFFIIKTLLNSYIDINRLKYKDTLSYFGIFLDHLRKTIFRLRFNWSKKSLCIVNLDKTETRYDLNSVNEIHKHKRKIVDAVKEWESLDKKDNTSTDLLPNIKKIDIINNTDSDKVIE